MSAPLPGDRGEVNRWLPAGVLVTVGLVAIGMVASGRGSQLVFASPFVLVPGALVLGWWLNSKRVAATRAWAAGIGWTWVGVDPSLVDRWRGQPFGVGDGRRASEVMTGPFGPYQCVLFTYRFTSGSGKERSTQTFTVLSLALPTFLPTLELTPENVGTRIIRAFGAQDLQFESDDFNRRWRVEARDPKFAHDVLHPRMLERLVRADAAGISLRVEGTDILCWTAGTPDLDRVATRLGVMRAVVDGVPRFVWLDHGYDPATT